jgi:hypothetical protein
MTAIHRLIPANGSRLGRTLLLLALLLATLHPTVSGARRIQRNPAAAPASGIAIVPRHTDPAIRNSANSHYLYLERDIIVAHDPELPADRHELLLWLTGTNGQGAGPAAFCELAARLGYRVIVLAYPDDIAATACKEDPDPAAFEAFRHALIAGGSTRHITISRPDSIENRLLKLLLYLKQHRPDEGWGQFLREDGGIRWEAIAVSGQSQGGGHAALIAIEHRVTRVICTGAPKDYSTVLRRPAAWYGHESATPKGCFFAFNHRQDGHNGCTFPQQLENLSALKLDQFGAPADVDAEPFPYRHTRILTTDCPASNPHTAVISTQNAARFQKVWTYLLTEKVP